MTMRSFTREARERERRDELLSAYLDGELSAEEQTRLEAQLAADPALRAELDALRHTVALVRNLPVVPVPCNFILPQAATARPRPAQRARPHRAWVAPFLTATTAIVSLMFVVVLAGDLLLSGSGGLATAPAAEQPAMRMMEAEAPIEAPQEAPAPAAEQVVVEAAVEVTVEVETEVEAEVETEEAVSLATVPADAALSMPVESPPEVETTAADESEEEGYVAEASREMSATVSAMGGGGQTMEPAAPSPVAVEKAAEAPTALATEMPAPETRGEGAEPIPGAWAEVEPPMAGEETRESERGVETVEQLTVISPWRVLEVILGIAALGLALVTTRAWRARRR